MKRTTISPLAVLFSVIMWLIGIILVMTVQTTANKGNEILSQIGFAFIVTGVVALFRETVIARARGDQTDERYKKLHDAVQDVNVKIENSFKDFDECYGSKAIAIKLIRPIRAGYDPYHHWLIHKNPEDLFFAGHSVLHRIQIDLAGRKLGLVEDHIVNKLSTGSTFKIVFLDPTWEFIKNIAESERQTPEKMLTDLAVSLGICRRLWTLLEDKRPNSGSINIWLSREIQQYAFHSVVDEVTRSSQILVGMYFATGVGMDSPLFSIDHREIQDRFTAHFAEIARRSKLLLSYSSPIESFNGPLYHDCRVKLSKEIGQNLVDQHCPI